LEDAITIFGQTKPEPEYQLSEYATGNRRWRRAPRFHPVEITELLNYEIQTKNNKNKILGDKVAQILKQNTDLSDKIAEEYQTPSKKRTQLWLWSRGQSPPTCSLSTAKPVKRNHRQKICLHGENHSSARRITQQGTSTNPECLDLHNQAKQPRRKQLLSGSYEIWQLHHSQSKQSAPWEKRSTSLQTRPQKICKLKETPTPTKRNLFSKRRSENESKIHDQQERRNSKVKVKAKTRTIASTKHKNLESESKTRNQKPETDT